MTTKQSLKEFVSEILDNAEDIRDEFTVFRSKHKPSADTAARYGTGNVKISEAQHAFIIKFINDRFGDYASDCHYAAMVMMFKA